MANSFLPGQIPFVVNIQQKQKPRVETIKENGKYNTEAYRGVNVQVPGATTKDLFEAVANGTYDIAEYAKVKIDVPNPSTGTLDITENNNNIDVKDYAAVNVNVPNPSSGTLDITENNIYDVTNYASVDVQVSGGGAELQANSVYITDEAGDIYGGPEPVSSSTLYFAGSETPLGTLNMSDGKVAYSDGMGEFETADLSDGNLFYYDGSSYEKLNSLNQHDVVYGESGNYSIFELQSGTYYQAGSNGAIDVADFDENCLYIFDSYGSSLNTPDPIGDVGYDKLNLVSYCADSELYCKTFDIPNVGEDVTVTLSGIQFRGSFKITRLS